MSCQPQVCTNTLLCSLLTLASSDFSPSHLHLLVIENLFWDLMWAGYTIYLQTFPFPTSFIDELSVCTCHMPGMELLRSGCRPCVSGFCICIYGGRICCLDHCAPVCHTLMHHFVGLCCQEVALLWTHHGRPLHEDCGAVARRWRRCEVMSLGYDVTSTYHRMGPQVLCGLALMMHCVAHNWVLSPPSFFLTYFFPLTFFTYSFAR